MLSIQVLNLRRNEIQIDWTSGGNYRYWVNTEVNVDDNNHNDPGTPLAAGTGIVGLVQLGAPDGFNSGTGSIYYDAYHARRTTPIPSLLIGDANGDTVVDSGDTVAVVNEWLSVSGANGQPDCNKDGVVDSGDTVCIVNKWLGGS